MIKNKTGAFGENYAARYLRDNNFDIISANFRTKMGEIDLIAEKRNTLHFVEVKARGPEHWFRPAEAVDENKQRRIILTAEVFLKIYKTNKKISFDIIEITVDENNGLESLNFIENAFESK